MPNDNAGSFPMPAADTTAAPLRSPEQGRTDEGGQSKNEIITDPVAPDLSAPPTLPTGTPTEAPTEDLPKGGEVGPVPATFKETSKPPIVTILLIVIAIGAVALTSFFYIQTQRLNSQLNEISQTIDNQKITPTPTPTEEPTPSPTIETVLTPTASPSPSIFIDNSTVWGDVKNVLSLAQTSHPKAVLLMVDSAYVQPGKELIAKYWFRIDPETKKYLYILKDSSKELSLVDQQVYLTPDNNIPSLNTLVKDSGLGIDFNKAVIIATNLCPKNFDCATSDISGKYIKSGGATIWQITLKNANKSFVVQIDSLTEKVIFKNL